MLAGAGGFARGGEARDDDELVGRGWLGGMHAGWKGEDGRGRGSGSLQAFWRVAAPGGRIRVVVMIPWPTFGVECWLGARIMVGLTRGGMMMAGQLSPTLDPCLLSSLLRLWQEDMHQNMILELLVTFETCPSSQSHCCRPTP